MVKIDFKRYFRERMWFGWMCTHTLDGVAQWARATDGRFYLPLVRLREYEIEDYKIVVDSKFRTLGVYKAIIK